MAGPSGPDAVTSSRGDLDKHFNMKRKGFVAQFGVMRCEALRQVGFTWLPGSFVQTRARH